jgi:hypothetical protein
LPVDIVNCVATLKDHVVSKDLIHWQRVHGARFRQKFTLEDAIGSHACSLEANMRVTNGIPLGSSLLLPVDTVICVKTLKALAGPTVIESRRMVRCSSLSIRQEPPLATIIGCRRNGTVHGFDHGFCCVRVSPDLVVVGTFGTALLVNRTLALQGTIYYGVQRWPQSCE